MENQTRAVIDSGSVAPEEQDLPYEIYSPIVVILVAAENATELPRLGKPRRNASKHDNHTVTKIHRLNSCNQERISMDGLTSSYG